MRARSIALVVVLAAGAIAARAPAPLPAPTPEPFPFAKGTTAGEVSDSVARGEPRYFTVPAKAGQELQVEVKAAQDNATLQVWEPGWKLTRGKTGGFRVAGKALAGAGEGDEAVRWSGKAPRAGAYLVVLEATRGSAQCTLRAGVK